MALPQILFLVLIFVVVVLLFVAVARMTQADPTQERLRRIAGAEVARRDVTESRFVDAVSKLAEPVGKLAAADDAMEQSNIKLRFAHAGIRSSNAQPLFFGAKTLLTLLLPVLGWLLMQAGSAKSSGTSGLLLLLLLAALGYYGPNLWLSNRVKARQMEIFENFPDALDLMTVCVEAGLGTEAAMLRVADDIQIKSPALGEELRLVNLELRAGADRERALRNLAIRTGVEEVDSFVSMINQAERFGTSVAASLRIHSEMLRTRRRQRAEEAGAKVSVKLLFPLMFCIFPALMVVLMGPAVIQVMRQLVPVMSGSQ